MNIHRCRFVEHQPAGIQHVAVTPCFYPNPRVAVARANGDIELWNTTTRLTPAQLSVSTGNSAKPEDAAATTHAAAPQLDGDIARKSWEIRRMDPPSWHSLGRITPAPGESGEASHIEALAWSVALSSSAGEISSDDDDDSDADSDAEMQGHGRTGDKHTATSTAMRPRLFAASLHGHITEYDVDTLSAVARVDSVGGGAVWCLAVTPCQRYLLAGCEDGRVRVYDISGPAGYVDYMRGFDRQNGRIVCVAVGTTLSADGDEITTVLTGGNDGQVLKWDLATGRNTGRMSVGRSRRQDDEVLVWDIAILK